MLDDPEYRALIDYAARIGADPSVVQAAGGNVSIKRDGVLWVKASGTWLAQAREKNIMVPVRLAPMLSALRDPDPMVAEDISPYVDRGRDDSGLRPSIETTMHGVLPHAVVVHVHCVDTIAWACRTDAATAIGPLLAGLAWSFVPYVRPGPPMTREIVARSAPGTDVVVLGNHGLVVGAETVAGAAALLDEVRRRLRRQPRAAPPPDAARLAAVAGQTGAVAAEIAHNIGTDAKTLAVARRGSYYPDHVIFLGPGLSVWPGRPVPPVRLSVVPGAGVLLPAFSPPAAFALARCLADVAARIGPEEPVDVLGPEREAELLGWDAEKYRQTLAP